MGSHGAHHGKVTVGGKAAARNNGYARAAELEATASDGPRRERGRKDTRRWCKGKPGVEHVPVIVFRPWYGRECRPPQEWAARLCPSGWDCEHREVCENCGKILREPWKLAKEECPAWRERTATVA
jgi:hypothetical protein